MGSPIVNTWCTTVTPNGETSYNFSDSPPEPIKALLGWNGAVVWDDKIDPVDLVRTYVNRAKAESCGQCFPCRYGTVRMADIMQKICDGLAGEQDLDNIASLAKQISQTARCDIGQTLAKPVLDILDKFRPDFLSVAKAQRKIRPGKYEIKITAPCVNACPSNVDVPSYLEDIRLRRWSKALATVRNDCPLPGTIGRVCVRPCEFNCRRGLLDDSLAIRYLKRFIADDEIENGQNPSVSLPPKKPQKVAIAGAGPAGLSCAYYLARKGYSCTIFEAQEGPGGMASYGIPSYRLPRNIMAHEVSVVQKLGVEIRYGVRIGKNLSVENLGTQGYQAVFLAVGAPETAKMQCNGEDAGYKGFMSGVQFLAEAARGKRPLEGKRLLVVGGGNVAMDCVRTGKRLGFDDIHLIYRRTEAEMPADPQEIREAKEEGIAFDYLMAPINIIAKDGKVVGLECQRMKLGEPDKSGRRRPEPIAGSEFVMDCDAIIPAVGQVCAVDCVLPRGDNAVTNRKTLVVDKGTFQTSHKNIFGGGDCVTGPKTLIAALAAGKHAARFIDQSLQSGACGVDASDILRNLIAQIGVYDSKEEFAYQGHTHRAHPETLDPDSRAKSFAEVEKVFTSVQAVKEASRCMRCYRIMVAAV